MENCVEERIENIKDLSEAITIYHEMKEKKERQEIDVAFFNYVLKQIESQFLEELLGISSIVFLELIIPKLQEKNININQIDFSVLQVIELNNPNQEEKDVQGKVCTYDGDFIALFGIYKQNQDKYVQYDIEEISSDFSKLKRYHGFTLLARTMKISDYYIISDGEKTKVFLKEEPLALVVVSDSFVGKMREKLTDVFKKVIPVLNPEVANYKLIYNSSDKHDEKIKTGKAGYKRMHNVLNKDRIFNKDVRVNI